MRVASFNINGYGARKEFLAHWLRARDPDVALLQEVKLPEDRFPAAELEAAGYRALFHGQKAWNGVAILSKLPLEPVQAGLPGQEELGARLLSARVGEVVFTSVYVPNGKSVAHEDFARKLVWLDELAAYLAAARAASPAHVVGGDFNLCPSGLDSWNEEGLRGRIFHTDDERARFQKLLAGGFVDVFRAQQPETRAFSWWDYRAGSFHKGQGLRIDFVLATEPIAARVRAAGIDREYRKKQDGLIPSDHAPVWIEFE